MSKILKKLKENKFVILYLIAFIAIVYGGMTANLISFVFGVLMAAWILLLRFKAWRTDEEGEEEGMEVNEENESEKDK